MWSILKKAVSDVIKANGNQEITGQALQNTLNSVITAVGENRTFAGVATPSMSPGTFDGPVFYVTTTVGTYNNFNGLRVEQGEIAFFTNSSSGSWSKARVEIFSAVSEGDAVIEALKQQIKELENSLKNYNDDAKEFEKRLDGYEENIADLEKSIEDVGNDIVESLDYKQGKSFGDISGIVTDTVYIGLKRVGVDDTQEWYPMPVSTTQQAGVMSSEDRKLLKDVIERRIVGSDVEIGDVNIDIRLYQNDLSNWLNITIPLLKLADKLPQRTNSLYITKDEVKEMIDAVHSSLFIVATELPEANESTKNKIYLIPAPDSFDNNIKNEYVTIWNGFGYVWEQIGSTEVDLSGYAKEEWVQKFIEDAIKNKADKSDTYTKGEVDSAIAAETKRAQDVEATKADKDDTYTKSEVDSSLSKKASDSDMDTMKDAVKRLQEVVNEWTEGDQGTEFTDIKRRLEALEGLIDDGDNPTEAIDKFNEIVEFLKGITNKTTLKNYLDSLMQDINDGYAEPITEEWLELHLI